MSNIPSPFVFAMFPLQEQIVDKDTGLPLANGIVSFFSDRAMTVPKDVYQQSLSPSNDITYTNLGPVLILSSIGTFVDGNGNNIIPFLYPFVGTPADTIPGASELYFISVYAAAPPIGTGALQFTVEDWPPNTGSGSSSIDTFQQTGNVVENPQFVLVNFLPTSGYTYTVTGSMTSDVAPGWQLITTGVGTVIIQQFPITAVWPTNMPFALDIQVSAGVTAVLQQTIYQSPRLFAGRFVSGSFVAATIGSASMYSLSLIYTPSTGSPQVLATGMTHSDGSFNEIIGNVAITNISTDSGATGFVTVGISIPASSHVQISSVQVTTVDDSTALIPFIEQSTPEQINGLYNYYNLPLQFKPIPSYLIGWDFSVNPYQFGASFPPFAQTNGYVCDQTILFQSNNSQISGSRAADGSLNLISSDVTSATKIALIQYLDVQTAVDLLNYPLSVNILANTGQVGGLTGTVSIWYTSNAVVPVIPLSLVTTLDANGHPSSVAAGWTELTRAGNLGNAQFQLTASLTSIGFNGWNNVPSGLGLTTIYVAIVVGTANITNTKGISVHSISLVPGTIPTIPAPQNYQDVLAECQRFYETSYVPGIVAGSVSADGYLAPLNAVNTGGATIAAYATPFSVPLRVEKRFQPNLVVLYNPATGSANSAIASVYASGGLTATANVATTSWTLIKNFNSIIALPNTGGVLVAGVSGIGVVAPFGTLSYHFTSDARLGVV